MKLRALLLLLFPLSLVAQLEPARTLPVEKIEITVHDSLSPTEEANAVRTKMKTKTGERFSQLDFDEDLKHLSEEYDRVEPRVVPQGEGVAITLNLWPKRKIHQIRIEGNERIKTARIRRELGIEAGSPFERHTFNQAFGKLKTLYVKKGNFEAEIDYRVIPAEKPGEVDVVITINEGRSGRIKKVTFNGFSRKEEKELSEMLSAKKHFILTSWATGAGTYQEEAVEQDRFIVLNFLQNEGYADASVDLNVADLPDQKGLQVTFTAHKGPRYHFGRVTYTGNTLFSDSEIEQRIGIQEGQTYAPDKLRETVRTLTDLYGSKGYIDAIVNYEPLLRQDEAVYDINFTINEGEQYRIGLIRIFGNRRTQHRVILNECCLVPGQVFDIRKLQRTEMTLRSIGYFDNVNVYAVRSPQERQLGPAYRDVYIEVEEKGTGSIGLFAGLSSTDSIFGGLELIEQNFNIRGLGRVFKDGLVALRGGGEYLRIRTNIGKKQRSYLASWTQPYFMDTNWIIGFDFEQSVSNLRSDDYTNQQLQGSFRATYPISACLRSGAHYRVRWMDTDVKRDDVVLPPELTRPGTVSAVGGNVTYDSVNFYRTRGLSSVLEAELAGFLGDFRFASFAFLNCYYHPLYRKGVVKLRFEARTVTLLPGQKFIDLPIQERLFLGGEASVRGYAPFDMGPQFLSPVSGTPVPGNPRGGLSSMLLSAELNHRFFRMLDGFIFVDAGYVSPHSWDVRTLRATAGFGVRIKLMDSVPVTLGWGYPLNREPYVELQRFFFSVGGRF
ncbi:MAG: outer membrane protein assembly factor BamA [Parachlamydiales bacterium]